MLNYCQLPKTLMKKSVEIKVDLGKAVADSVIFKNTFAQHFSNTEFTLAQIRGGIKLGAIKPDQIPKEIRDLL